MIESHSVTERARQGDPDAIAGLLRSSEPDLRRFAARVCHTESDADDAVAHAMSTLALRLGTFRGMSLLSTWLFAVIRNECRKYERLARRWIFGITESAVDPMSTPEQMVSRAEMLELVVGAVRELRPELREVFVLREFERLSVEACAERLGITENNVKVRFHRARADLRQTLSELR